MSPATDNPFQSSSYAARYARWYESPRGERLARQEQAVLGALLTRHFHSAATAVDIGCGTGVFTEWLRTRGLASVGVELSSAMLSARPETTAARYVQADARLLPFARAQFDLALMVTALEFMPDPRRALQEAARVARRGMLLGVLNRWSWTAFRRRLASRFSESVYRSAHFYSGAQLKNLVRDAVGDRVSRVALCFAPRTLSPVASSFLGLAVKWS